MSPEETSLARLLVALPAWRWVPGMVACVPDDRGHVTAVLDGDEGAAALPGELRTVKAAPVLTEWDLCFLAQQCAELLRHAVRRLDVNADKVVPTQAQLAMKAALNMQQQMPMPAQGTPAKPDQEQLQNGGPVTDNFKPTPKPAAQGAA